MNDNEYLEKEQKSIKAIKEIAKIYGDELSFIWHWGGYKGGDGVLSILTKYMIEHGFINEDKSNSNTPKKAKIKKKISARTRLNVLMNDGYQCVKCGSNKDLTIDHIMPESLGGSKEEENLQTLCRICNSKKGVKIL
jgi:hypothetical protein